MLDYVVCEQPCLSRLKNELRTDSELENAVVCWERDVVYISMEE